jgi:hypothetical protein
MARRRTDDDDALFRVSPADFVSARNRVVGALRAAGKRDEASAIARLRKPSPVLWATNQIARDATRVLDRLLEAVDRLKRAQLAGRDDLRAATDAQRSALETLIAAAREKLRAIGVRESPALLARVSATLLGAAVDPAVRDDLRAGRLTEERGAPGFEAFAGVSPRAVHHARRSSPGAKTPSPSLPRPSAAPRRRDEPRPARAARNVVTLERAIRARDAQRAAEADRDERERQANVLDATAAQRRADVQAAETAVAEILRQLREARQRVTEARRAAATAAHAARRAHADADRAARKARKARRPQRRSATEGPAT